MAKKRYSLLWRNKFLTTDCKSLSEMQAALAEAADQLGKMAADGVALEGGVEDDYAELVTTDPKVAKKYGMEAG